MSESGSEPKDVFDIARIRRLVELMEEHDLGEVNLREGEQTIQLKRGVGAPVNLGPSVAPAPSASFPAAAPASPAAPAAASEEPNIHYITSPMVGTFYTKANPESAPFVNVGDHVSPDTTVCIIEAMKVFNEIAAECTGKIVAVLVENEEPVEFGMKIFKVDTSPE